MYKQVLNSITDIDIFPIISLIVFVSFFILMILKVMATRKEFADKMAAMPLEEDDSISLTTETKQV